MKTTHSLSVAKISKRLSDYDSGFDINSSCFGYYDSDGREFRFQLTLEQIKNVISGSMSVIDADPAD